jgi:hypothetical protein
MHLPAMRCTRTPATEPDDPLTLPLSMGSDRTLRSPRSAEVPLLRTPLEPPPSDIGHDTSAAHISTLSHVSSGEEGYNTL